MSLSIGSVHIAERTPGRLSSGVDSRLEGAREEIERQKQQLEEAGQGLRKLAEERRENLRSMGEAIAKFTQVASEARKAQARARAEQIKEQLKMLKQMAATMGATAPKSLLRQIQQLAKEVKAIASALSGGTSDGGSSGNAALSPKDVGSDQSSSPVQAAQEQGSELSIAAEANEGAADTVDEPAQTDPSAVPVESEGADAQGEVQRSQQEKNSGQNPSDARESSGAFDKMREKLAKAFPSSIRKGLFNARQDSMNAGDAKLVKELVSDLRQLLAVAKANLQEEKNRKQAREVGRQLDEVERLPVSSSGGDDGGVQYRDAGGVSPDPASVAGEGLDSLAGSVDLPEGGLSIRV